jgi:hypothetical protein
MGAAFLVMFLFLYRTSNRATPMRARLSLHELCQRAGARSAKCLRATFAGPAQYYWIDAPRSKLMTSSKKRRPQYPRRIVI